jgi:hypothetical protein
MSNNNQPAVASNLATKSAARLRMVGTAVLFLGLVVAGLVYWLGVPPEDLSADPATAWAYKRTARDTEINFGQVGVLLDNLLDHLKHPGIQAAIIAGASLLFAGACFGLAQVRTSRGNAEKPPA